MPETIGDEALDPGEPQRAQPAPSSIRGLNRPFTLSIAPVPGQPTQKALSFSPRFTDRTYTITAKSPLTAPAWSAITASAPSDNGTTRTITDLSATPALKYYHVEITKP